MALVQPNYGAAPVAGTPAAVGPGAVRSAATAPAVSRLVQMQARFQKRQMEEKEQKLLRLYESQQQRAFQRVGRGSAGSSTASLSSSTSTLASLGGGGKVRQLFEERRSNGWDRSYPLEPVATGGKAATRPSNGPQQPLPLAVPKTKLTRGASLDRSQHQQQQPPVAPQYAKNAARRSKSHARAADAHHNGHNGQRALNGFYDNDRGGHVYRKAQVEEEYNGRNFRRHLNHQDPEDDPDRDEDEEEDFPEDNEEANHRPQPQQRFVSAPDNKRQEDLFAKYQVRELTHNDFPPYDDGIDEGTFIYEKESNGGHVNNNPNNHNDRFKTYVSNKHNRQPQQPFKDEIIPRAAMATKVQDAKKVPTSPPARAVKPPAKKNEQTNATGSSAAGSPAPPNQRTGAKASATKKAPSVSRPTSSPLSKNIQSTKAPQKVRNGPSAPAPAARLAPTRDDLTECPICHRRFTNDRIKVHQDICAKTKQKKRKEYDATKHRVQGTEAEQFVRRPMRAAVAQKKFQTEPKKADWRKKHEEFIQTIRAAKEAQAHVAAGGKLSDLPPPPPLDTSDYVQCPHCGRKFNEAAADRHIPRCANMQHNKPKPVGKPAGGGVGKRR